MGIAYSHPRGRPHIAFRRLLTAKHLAVRNMVASYWITILAPTLRMVLLTPMLGDVVPACVICNAVTGSQHVSDGQCRIVGH